MLSAGGGPADSAELQKMITPCLHVVNQPHASGKTWSAEPVLAASAEEVEDKVSGI